MKQTHSSLNQLAVIIPAYKSEFLDEALESLAAQTCKDFKVYIGDDASPHDLASIVEPYKACLDIVYKRFETNVGGVSLTQQWDRCVKLSSEPWVWLFSDDDIVEPECVETFFQTLENTSGEYDLYRFNTCCINADGDVTRYMPPHPAIETSLEFVYHRLVSQRSSFVVEYIFSRRAFDVYGGFVDFPVAWNSDDATWVSLGRRSGICTMAGPLVCWRKSGLNLSSNHPVLAERKIEAGISYLEWLESFFCEETSPVKKLVDSARYGWFKQQLRTVRIPCQPFFIWRTARWASRFLRKPLTIVLFGVLSIAIQLKIYRFLCGVKGVFRRPMR